MAGKGRERFEKRQRERDKQRKAEAKREQRRARAEDRDDDGEEGPSEEELLQQVGELNEKRAQKLISDEEYEERRAELFEALGLE